MKFNYSFSLFFLALLVFTFNAWADTADPYPRLLEDGVLNQRPPPTEDKNCKFSSVDAQGGIHVFELPAVCIVPPQSTFCGPIDVGWHNEFGQNTNTELFYWFDKAPCNWEGGTQVDGYFRPEWVKLANPVAVTVLCACERLGSVGCFPPGTEISMADGSSKPVEKIASGEKVLNPVTKKAVRVGRVIQSAEAKPLIEVGYEMAKVRVTQTHPMMTKDGLKKAAALSLGEEVRGADGTFHKITVLKELPVVQGQQVVNFELAPDEPGTDAHLVLADGLVTGDFVLQLGLNKP
jgi:hypothetical protein